MPELLLAHTALNGQALYMGSQPLPVGAKGVDAEPCQRGDNAFIEPLSSVFVRGVQLVTTHGDPPSHMRPFCQRILPLSRSPTMNFGAPLSSNKKVLPSHPQAAL